MENFDYKGMFASELEEIISYMKEKLPTLYSVYLLNVDHFVYAVLKHNNCLAYQALNKILLESTKESMQMSYEAAFNTIHEGLPTPGYSNKLNEAITNSAKDSSPLTSAHVLLYLLQSDENTKNMFSRAGAIVSEVIGELKNIISTTGETAENMPMKHKKRNPMGKPSREVQGIVNSIKEYNEVDRNCVNLNNLAEEGKVDEVIGNKNIIDNILNILCKKNKNNVILTGDSGIGKTATVKHIANLITRGEVPRRFKKSKLVILDFMTLVSNTTLRGAFESKFDNIVRDAKGNNYIFVIDDIQSILSERSKFGEVDIQSVLDKILLEKSIGVITTCSNQGYRAYFDTNPSLSRRFQRIHMNPPTVEEAIDILNYAKIPLEQYHNVRYTDKAIEAAVKLGNRYISQAKLPDSAIDLIDEAAAKKVLWMKTTSDIEKYQEMLDKIHKDIKEIEKSDKKDYNKIDVLRTEEISVKAVIAKKEKDEILLSKPLEIDENDIRIIITDKTNIPLNQVTTNEKASLKNISETLKKSVVGQDDAIDAVSRVIKRQRIGIANPNRPSVFLFMGVSGTGKTYLAKKIAEEVFGNEKYLVRFDMSEFADKMSVNKLYGSAPGYIGYEQGGQLTEAIKKNKYCVLLLDEIEKADAEVHNVFLQLFDEGRLTDNMGNTVDFKNVIVIMTSNVGAKRLNDMGKGIGMVKTDNTIYTKDVLDKELKNAFKPEFLNRINKVVYFNKLNDESLFKIVCLEIEKVGKKLEAMGYKLDENFINSPVANEIYETVRKDKSFGARPIMRQIEDKIEDVITDYILDHEVENGHVFTYDELYG